MAITVRVLGFPITIGYAFPIAMVVLGYLSRLAGIDLVVWVIFGTLAITLHELGHAIVFRRFGLESSIQFWLLGGLAIPNDQQAAADLPDGEWLAVSLAGPAVGLVLGAIGLALQGVVVDQSADVRSAVGIWTFVNLGWGIFNLLPITGLDGGSAVLHVMQLVFGDAGRAIALTGSIVFSAVVAVVAAENGYTFVAIIAVLFGLANPNQYKELFATFFPGRAQPGPGSGEARPVERARRPTFEEPPGPAWPEDDDRQPPPEIWRRP
jgi:stage IV sporulation protein FB